LGNVDAKFYKDIQYGNSKENLFDIFLPESKKPSSLVVYIHGGGFINGNKTMPYQRGANTEMIKNFLSHNIAFTTLDYTLLKPGNTQGVLMCLNDSKRALQFIRYHSKALNIDKKQVILMGGSAGAGTSLWIAFNDDMADKKSSDPVLKESTRVKGVLAFSTQATYDISKWADPVFKEYEEKGFNQKTMQAILTKNRALQDFYGADNNADSDAAAFKKYSNKIDMIGLMSSDDPEIYVENTKVKYEIPTTTGAIQHHPLHAKALMDVAGKKNIKGKFYIPEMNIDTRGGESKEDFVIRLIGK
jgi:hypothetical protein